MFYAICFNSYTMPFARRVVSCLSLRVVPLSPCNYNALYRTILRRPFVVCPRAFWRCASVRAASWQCCGGVAVGGIYTRRRVVWVFGLPKRRTRGEWQRLYILLYPLRTNILYILYATEYIRYARLRFACKRTFRTQTEGTGRRVSSRLCIFCTRCIAAVCVKCVYQCAHFT